MGALLLEKGGPGLPLDVALHVVANSPSEKKKADFLKSIQDKTLSPDQFSKIIAIIKSFKTRKLTIESLIALASNHLTSSELHQIIDLVLHLSSLPRYRGMARYSLVSILDAFFPQFIKEEHLTRLLRFLDRIPSYKEKGYAVYAVEELFKKIKR